MVIVLLVLGVFAVVVVVLRFWARAIQKVSLQLNDFLILPALVGTNPVSSLLTLFTMNLGFCKRDQWLLDIRSVTPTRLNAPRIR